MMIDDIVVVVVNTSHRPAIQLHPPPPPRQRLGDDPQRLPPPAHSLAHLPDLVRPLAQPLVKRPTLIRIQHPRLDPMDVGQGIHLVDRPFDQAQTVAHTHTYENPSNPKSVSQPLTTPFHPPGDSRQGLHDEMFDLDDGQLGLLCDRLKRHRPLTPRTSKHGLDERHQADLLTQEIRVCLEDRL